MRPPKHRYLSFLISLLLLLLIQPLAGDYGEEGLTLRQVTLSLFMTVALVLGTLASCNRPRHIAIGMSLAALTIVAVWILPALDDAERSWSDSLIGRILGACPALFYFYTASLTLGFVLRGRHVTRERIFAALCVYLLIGFAFSLVYLFINGIDTSEAFRFSEESLGEAGPDVSWSDFVFFSFVTMTTLGYGDISPLNDWARSLAVLQTIFAVFYMAVLIAKLIGSYQLVAAKDGNPGPDDG